jgi:hypothetical protein
MLGLDGEAAAAAIGAVEQPEVAGRRIQRTEVLFPKPASV